MKHKEGRESTFLGAESRNLTFLKKENFRLTLKLQKEYIEVTNSLHATLPKANISD